MRDCGPSSHGSARRLAALGGTPRAEADPPPATDARLLDHLQLRAAHTALLRGLGPRRRLRTQVLLGEHHSLAGLARVNAKHRAHRKSDVVDHAGEARVELHLLVAEAQALGGALAQVEHDLAVLDVGTRHLGPLPPRIDDDVWGVAALADPLMHGAQQVGALGQHLARGAHSRISCSRSDRPSRNAGRENTSCAYFSIGWACGGRSIS